MYAIITEALDVILSETDTVNWYTGKVFDTRHIEKENVEQNTAPFYDPVSNTIFFRSIRKNEDSTPVAPSFISELQTEINKI